MVRQVSGGKKIEKCSSVPVFRKTKQAGVFACLDQAGHRDLLGSLNRDSYSEIKVVCPLFVPNGGNIRALSHSII